jgi:UDP-N-acetyl-D-mannosaminuronic acid transferase (WecB/TagA/CpsF family)
MTSTTAINLAMPTSRFRVLGVTVDAVQIPEVIARMERWIVARSAWHVDTENLEI